MMEPVKNPEALTPVGEWLLCRREAPASQYENLEVPKAARSIEPYAVVVKAGPESSISEGTRILANDMAGVHIPTPDCPQAGPHTWNGPQWFYMLAEDVKLTLE